MTDWWIESCKADGTIGADGPFESKEAAVEAAGEIWSSIPAPERNGCTLYVGRVRMGLDGRWQLLPEHTFDESRAEIQILTGFLSLYKDLNGDGSKLRVDDGGYVYHIGREDAKGLRDALDAWLKEVEG